VGAINGIAINAGFEMALVNPIPQILNPIPQILNPIPQILKP
jgi:ABC-type nitrate/sulfonate/bicarbonate transport system permease component